MNDIIISTKPLEKSLNALKRALDQEKNEFTRGAVIQCFEVSFELSWKLLKRYLESNQSLKDLSVKDLFRQAGREGIISNVENWFISLKSRNLTSHTYNEDTADEVYQHAFSFYKDAKELLKNIETHLANA